MAYLVGGAYMSLKAGRVGVSPDQVDLNGYILETGTKVITASFEGTKNSTTWAQLLAGLEAALEEAGVDYDTATGSFLT